MDFIVSRAISFIDEITLEFLKFKNSGDDTVKYTVKKINPAKIIARFILNLIQR